MPRKAFLLLLLAVCATEAFAQCTYSLSTSFIRAPWEETRATITVTTAPGCAWSGTYFPPDPLTTFVYFVPGFPRRVNGVGSGQFEVLIAGNPHYQRRGEAISVAGQIIVFEQEPRPCPPHFVPETATEVAPDGGTHSFWVYGPCAWTATSHVSWITVTSGASSWGDGPVAFRIDPNDTGATRVGTLTIAGQTYTVTQTVCANVAPMQLAPAAAATVSSPVIFTWSAAPQATSYNVWVTDRDGVTRLAASTGATSASIELAGGTYSWHVQALSSTCAATTTCRGAFTVADRARRRAARP